MNEKTYILTQILEDDYGCEERPAGQAVTVLALLTDSEGNETVLRQEEISEQQRSVELFLIQKQKRY